MKTIAHLIATLSLMALVACSNEPSEGETRSVTAADIGFVAPALRSSRVTVGEIQPNTPVATVVQKLEKAGFKVRQTTEARKWRAVNEDNVTNTLVSDIKETQLSADLEIRNTHPDSLGIAPDMNVFHTSATIYDDRHLASAELKVQWSDRHHLGVSFSQAESIVMQALGSPSEVKPNGDWAFYYDRSGASLSQPSADSPKAAASIGKCSDPKAGITSNGNPMYDRLVCSLEITYRDDTIREAFYQEVPSLLNKKLIALFGPLKPRK